jgi:hypothetical protein
LSLGGSCSCPPSAKAVKYGGAEFGKMFQKQQRHKAVSMVGVKLGKMLGNNLAIMWCMGWVHRKKRFSSIMYVVQRMK